MRSALIGVCPKISARPAGLDRGLNARGGSSSAERSGQLGERRRLAPRYLTFRAAKFDDVIAEARGRSVTALARLGYLAEWADRNDIAAQIEKMLPSRLPVTFLGPRDSRKRWNQRWRVYDANLPGDAKRFATFTICSSLVVER